jgi:hypothetical protein
MKHSYIRDKDTIIVGRTVIEGIEGKQIQLSNCKLYIAGEPSNDCSVKIGSETINIPNLRESKIILLRD